MDRQLLSNVCEQVYHRFPEVSGSRPKVQSRPGDQFLLVFTGASKAADGRKINQTVRVVVSQSGKIIQMTASK